MFELFSDILWPVFVWITGCPRSHPGGIERLLGGD